MVVCPTCKTVCHGDTCLECVSRMANALKMKRENVVNEAMSSLTKEANEVLRKDPTRGRGRGPKWID